MQRILFFLLIGHSFFAAAQTETQIREHYTAINKKIETSLELGFEGPLYNNQWITNKNGRSWPAVGIYTVTTDFWYDDDPDHPGALERGPKNVLQKVNCVTKSSHLEKKEEYLYQEGKLIFYYAREGEEGNEWETRTYFTYKGIMFRSSVKANGKELAAKDFITEAYKDLKPNSLNIQKNAKTYQDLFLKSML